MLNERSQIQKTICDSIYMKCPKWANLQRQNSVLKKEGNCLPHATLEMNLENIMLSEINQTQKDTFGQVTWSNPQSKDKEASWAYHEAMTGGAAYLPPTSTPLWGSNERPQEQESHSILT